MLAGMTDVLRGFEPAPQDLVLSLLGAHHVPRERGDGVVGRARAAAGGVRLLRGRRAGGAQPAGRPRAAGPEQGRPARPLRAHPRARSPCSPRATGGSSRSAESAAPGDHLDGAVALDPRGPQARPHPAGAAAAVPRLRLGAGRHLARPARPRGRGRRSSSTSWTSPTHAGVLLGRPATAIDFAHVRRPRVGPRRAGRRGTARSSSTSATTTSTERSATGRPCCCAPGWCTRSASFPFLDPELPEDLVPAPEHRAEALRLFHDLYPALAPAAQRYFDEVTVP